MKKILAIFILVIAAVACTEDFDEMNIDPKNASSNVPATTLLSNGQKNLADVVTSTNVNLNVFRLLSQYWTETTYTDESRYDLSTRNIPQNFWNVLYRDVLRDLREARNLTNANADIDEGVKGQQLAIIEITEIYAWMVLVNTYGDVPYTEALDIENVIPKYDDDAAIYNDLLVRIDNALTALNTEVEGGAGADELAAADLIYGGDIEKWIKFGNSLKLKLGMTIADVDPGKARTVVEAAAADPEKLISSNEDNAAFQYLNTPPNTNPIWVDLVQSGRRDYVAANTIVNEMNRLEDPRREAYFTTVALAADDPATPDVDETVPRYVGGIYGRSNSYSRFSKPDEQIASPTFEGLLMDYSEVEFFLAEAVERGFAVGGTAEEHYNAAIRASMEYWGVEDEAVINNYLSQPEVAYTSPASGADFREKIGTQKWIALYNRGTEGWTEWRRLDAPDLVPPANAVLPEIPVRFPYPVQEQNLNTANYQAASGAIGGDVTTSKVFWDVR
ncbi:SusD/RagB family nutrient-binding outer membrane lipoprotein [Pontibacter ruber]|uniref:SusD/RagB family nutrient-binding outer membrane lipoprotein n=1 Tax=Pontibacter ruber TaxID=1343895 RepID=A0ABW5D3A7_9BACT|nr:SusD/RagB family nutrient-binding outer membrane lipoprotein [Pontibacter ruber]